MHTVIGGLVVALIAPVTAIASSTPANAAANDPVVVYDSIGGSTPGNVPSVGFQATQTAEFGDAVRLAAGPRALTSVTVMMSSWACEAGTWNGNDCVTTPNDTFDQPLTLNVYSVTGTDAAPAIASTTPIATATQTFAIPYRPSADATNCTGSDAGKWFDAAAGACRNGKANPVTFTFPGTTVLPSRVVWSIAYNTTNFGASPVGASVCSATVQGCPYDSLNVGTYTLSPAPYVGTDLDEAAQFRSATLGDDYCDGGAGGTGTLRNDAVCNAGYRPLATIVTKPISATSTTVVVDGLHSNGWRFIDDNNDPNPLLPPTFVTGPAPTPLGTGSVQLQTLDPNDRHNISTTGYLGTPLANLTALDYSIFQPTAGSTYTMALQFDVKYHTGDSGYQGRLVFEPANGNGGVVAGWQRFSTLTGKWWASKTTAAGSNGLCGQGAPCTWSEVQANWPTASINGALLVRAGGGGWPAGFTGNVDAVTVGVDNGAGSIATTTFDFENNTPTLLPIAQQTVLSTQIGGEDSNAQVWNADHFPGKNPGVESVVIDPAPTTAGGATATLTNGNLKLSTLANEQARVVNNFPVATAPTLRDLLAQRPQYSVYVDRGLTDVAATSPPGGNLQFGLQCGAWLVSVVMSPSDLPGTTDINGDLPAFDTWQTFRYPDPADATQKVFTATDGGTVPAGFLGGFTAVSITKLIDQCGDSKIIDARASQGRTTYTRVVSYLDDLQFMGNTYDFQFVTPTAPAAVTTSVFGNTIGGENNTTAEWSYDHFEPKVPGTESVVTDAAPVAAAGATASLLNGNLKLHTVGNANSALAQQARVVHTYAAATAPTLIDVLYSRPTYSVFVPDAASLNGQGNFQFGFQCGNWLGSVLISPTDLPGTTDINGNLPAVGTWQTYRYPSSSDPASQVFVATDGGTAPIGFVGFTAVKVTDLLDRCANAKVVDARASMGRNNIASATSYFDNVTVLNHTYDFVTNIAPSITSGAPVGGVVGSPYTFTFTATGTPTPTITTVGTLPAGLTLNGAGVLSGTPTAAGTVSFIVNAANGVAPDDNDLVSVTISPFGVAPHITSGAATAGVVGTAYSFPFTATGTPAPTFTSTGTLPAGLTLSSTGVLSGTPTADGTFTFLVTASNGFSPNDSALVSVIIAPQVASGGPVQGAAATPIAVPPARLLDTRLTTIPASGSTTNLTVTGLHGVPADAQAVFLNVTAVESTGPGYVTVWPAGTTKPGTSNLNIERVNQTIPNMVVTPVSATGAVSIYVQTSTHLVVDVMGYIPAGAGYTALTPQRALDTRTTTRPGDGATTVVKVTDVAGAPAGATAVIMNLTAVQAGGAGYFTVGPTGQAPLATSNLNVDHTGQTRPNMVIVPIGADGKISIYQQTSADILVDVVGFFTPEAKYNAVQPSQRLLDTRPPTQGYAGGIPAPNTTVTVKVAGVGSVPSDAKYVVVNLTGDKATNAGYVTVFPGGTTRPVASNLNMDGPGATASNLAFVPVGADGNIQVYTQTGTHLVLDVFGWVR